MISLYHLNEIKKHMPLLKLSAQITELLTWHNQWNFRKDVIQTADMQRPHRIKYRIKNNCYDPAWLFIRLKFPGDATSSHRTHALTSGNS